MVDLTQIHPLTDFLRNHRTHVARLKATRIPEVLTVNGKAELVLVDVETYQTLVRKAEDSDLLDAIRVGLDAAERGEMKPAELVLAEMRARYGLSG